jgi:hypothetical protein
MKLDPGRFPMSASKSVVYFLSRQTAMRVLSETLPSV